MDMFEYVMVLASIIIGLGITHMLTGLAGIVQRPAGVKVSRLHLVWVAYAFLINAFWWWWQFRLQEKIAVWTFPQYMFVLLFAVGLFLYSALLFPPHLARRGDYGAYFMDRRGWFFGIGIVLSVFDVTDSWLKGADYLASLGPGYLIQLVAQIVASSIAIWTRDLRYHWPLAIWAVGYQLVIVMRSYGTMG